MIHGTFTVKRVIENTTCKLSEDSRLEKFKTYKVHSAALMPNVPFGSPKVSSASVNSNCVKGSAKLPSSVKTQNYITAVYVGSDPPTKEKDQYLADPSYKTKKGTKFVLTCVNGDPNDRVFDEVH